MYNIIPLAIICVSLLIIIFIMARKFPVLAVLDVENIPAEKEARFKEKIIESRVERFFAKWKIRFFKFFKFFGDKIAGVFKWFYDRLLEMRKNYAAEKAPATPQEKIEKVKILFDQNEKLDDNDDFEEKESNLIKIIELEPRNTEAFKALGDLYFVVKKYEEAKQAWAHILKLLGDSGVDFQSEIYYNLSLLYKEILDNVAAMETIKMATKMSPNNPRYLDALVEISIINKDKESAILGLEKMIEVNPDNGKIGDFKEQIEGLSKIDKKV